MVRRLWQWQCTQRRMRGGSLQLALPHPRRRPICHAMKRDESFSQSKNQKITQKPQDFGSLRAFGQEMIPPVLSSSSKTRVQIFINIIQHSGWKMKALKDTIVINRIVHFPNRDISFINKRYKLSNYE